MPQIAAAVVGVGAKALATKVGAHAFVSSIIGASASAATSYFLAPKQKNQDINIDSEQFTYDRSGIQQTSISNIQHHNIVYGKRIVGGVLANRTTTTSVKGENPLNSDNQYVNSYQAIAAHKINSIEKYYINEEEVILDSTGYVYEKDNASFSNEDKYVKSTVLGNIIRNSRIMYFILSDGSQIQLEYQNGNLQKEAKTFGFIYALKPSQENLTVNQVQIEVSMDQNQINDPSLDYSTTPLFVAGDQITVPYAEYESGYSNQEKTLTLGSDSVYDSGSKLHTLTFIADDQIEASDPVWSRRVYKLVKRNIGRYNETLVVTDKFVMDADRSNPDWPRKEIISEGFNVKSVGFIESLKGDNPQRPTYRMAEGASMDIDKNALNNYEFGNNISIIYNRFRFVEGVFSSFPEVKVMLKGALCYDPRSDATVWTDNPALIARDFLISSYGFEINDSRIDDTYTIAAANICDENVDVGDGEVQKKYRCNIVLSTGNDHFTNIQKILDSMYGRVVVVQGKFRIYAGAYMTPSITINEDYLSGGVSLSSHLEVRNVYNAVRGMFVNEDNNYTATDYIEQTNTTYQDEDGRKIYQEVNLDAVSNHKQAQRIAQMHLKKSRYFGTLTLKCNDKAKELSVNDNVYVNLDYLGILNKTYRIVSMTFDSNLEGITLTLEEDHSSIYSHDDNLVNFRPTSTLKPYTVQAPNNLRLEEQTFIVEGTNKVDTKLVISFDASQSSTVTTYQVEHKRRGDNAFQVSGRTQSNTFEILNTFNGLYTVRVKSIDSIGRSSSYSSKEIVAYGLVDPPSDIDSLFVEQTEGRAYLSWAIPQDLDVIYGGHIIIKHNRDTTANWAESPVLSSHINASTNQANFPAMTGKYMIKAVDAGGRESATATEVIFTKADISDFDTVLTLTENPTFSGTKFQMSVVNNLLQLDGDILFDSASATFDDGHGKFDDAAGLFDLGNLTGYKNSGRYEFGPIDLGSVMSCNIETFIKYTQGDLTNFFDSKLGFFDDAQGKFDGDIENNTYVTTQLFVAETDDDPNGTPTWSEWKEFLNTDLRARGFKFKVEVIKTLNTANIYIEELKAITNIKNKVDDGTVTTSGSGSTTVNFSKEFYNIPTVVPVIQTAHQSDHVEISNVTKTSFDLTTYHGGSIASKDVYWIAKGV